MQASDHASGLISDYLSLLRRPAAISPVAVSVSGATLPVRDPARPCAVILSPHPDDECLTGALPLRLRQEQNWQIINIAVTLGGKVECRAARRAELAQACAVLGFDFVVPGDEGFSHVAQTTRAGDPAAWRNMTARLAALIESFRPQAIFLPHADDAHPAHCGTHALGMDALAALLGSFSCAIFQTEYWQPHAEPNLMIGIGAGDAALLLTALGCHAGENARNAFDARFPAYLIDTARRGSERVGGAGASSAAADFAMLYHAGLWRSGKFMPSALRRIVGAGDGLDEILG